MTVEQELMRTMRAALTAAHVWLPEDKVETLTIVEEAMAAYDSYISQNAVRIAAGILTQSVETDFSLDKDQRPGRNLGADGHFEDCPCHVPRSRFKALAVEFGRPDCTCSKREVKESL